MAKHGGQTDPWSTPKPYLSKVDYSGKSESHPIEYYVSKSLKVSDINCTVSIESIFGYRMYFKVLQVQVNAVNKHYDTLTVS